MVIWSAQGNEIRDQSRGSCYRLAMLEGLPPNNAAYVMRLRCAEDTARAIADIIVETFDPADTAAAAFEEATTTVTWHDNSAWIVEVYFGNPPDEDNVRNLVAVAAGKDAAAAVIFGRVEQKDWVASSLEGLNAVRAGRFLVHGSHDRKSVRSNDIPLEIEAALAFGTGHHGTTRGCLLMLDRITKQRRPHKILDVGTGTGVLAIAAAKLLHQKVEAGDIDPISVEATASNARLNGATPWIKPVVATGIGHPALKDGGPYDLILANILAKPLRLLAPGLISLAADRCDVVLSGLLGHDVPGVLAAYRAQGFWLNRRIDIDNWATLLMARGGASPRPLK